MAAPSEVDVGPFIYDVLVDADLIDKIAGPDEILMGFTDFAALQIVLDPGQADDQMRDTLMHECLHALVAMLGLDQEWKAKTEGYVARLSPALLALLRDNPKLVSFLVAS